MWIVLLQSMIKAPQLSYWTHTISIFNGQLLCCDKQSNFADIALNCWLGWNNKYKTKHWTLITVFFTTQRVCNQMMLIWPFPTQIPGLCVLADTEWRSNTSAFKKHIHSNELKKFVSYLSCFGAVFINLSFPKVPFIPFIHLVELLLLFFVWWFFKCSEIASVVISNTIALEPGSFSFAVLRRETFRREILPNCSHFI